MNGVTTDERQSGEIMFGNLPRAAGLVTIGSYTGLGSAKFADTLCMDYHGATCPEAFAHLWQPADHGTDVALIDAMRVSTLVLQRSLLPDVVDRTPPPGWRVISTNGVRTVWERDQPLRDDGRVSWSSPGVSIRNDSSGPQREVVRYRCTNQAGRLLFARLDWPGYAARLDNDPIEVVNGAAGLVAINVPPGEQVLTLQFNTPGLRLGFIALAMATAVMIFDTLVWHLRRGPAHDHNGTLRKYLRNLG